MQALRHFGNPSAQMLSNLDFFWAEFGGVLITGNMACSVWRPT